VSFEHNDIKSPFIYYILLKFHHFIENFNNQSLLHKMNDDESDDPLLDAIVQNDTATASSLMSSGSVNLNGKPWPLHLAAQLGRVEIMTMLLDAGADINAVDKSDHSRTACHGAIWGSHFDALKLLVERGANLGVVDSDGRSLLSNVVRYQRKEPFVILLLDADTPLDGLSAAVLMTLVKSVAVFNRLMARGVNLTAMRDKRGVTLCHYVASNVACEDDLRFLVNVCGNDVVHAVDNRGNTPLHWAYGSDSAVRVLVELGADIDRQDNDGWTALHYAAASTQSSCVDLLIALGADVNLIDRWGTTASRRAADRQRPASLCAVVAAGGDLDQPDSKGETPRMIAAERHVALPTAKEIDVARRRIAKTRIDLVRERAFQICLGLQPLNINALQLCEILMHSFGAIGSVIAFHQWWAIATKVKHFRDHKQRSSTSTTTNTE
jgi:ankyrin repeat protein